MCSEASKASHARTLCVSVHVDENVNAVLVDAVGGAVVFGDRREVHKVLGLGANSPPEVRAVVRRERVAEHLDAIAIVHSRQTLHQVRRRVIPEVGRHVPNAQANALHQ